MPRNKKTTQADTSNIVPNNETIDTQVFDYILENHAFERDKFCVKPYLNPTDQMKFCANIVETVFIDAAYTPALFDFAQKFATIICYTDIAIPLRENSIDELSEVVYASDLIKYIYDSIDKDQYNALVDAAKLQISETNMTIRSYSEADNMYHAITSLINKATTYLDKFGSILEKKFKKLNIDQETIAQITSMAHHIANLDEGSIAKELVEHLKETPNNIVPFKK